MAIDNNADFTPTIPDAAIVPTKVPYNPTGSFKFWAQKVIPLVYDDSLSYYEVLCKVVAYLNSVIQNVDNLNDSLDSTNQSFGTLENYVNTTKNTLIATYNELQGYVNTYFDNLDVQDEINEKLDTMARTGQLNPIIAPYIPSLVSAWLAENVSPTSPAIDKSLSIENAGADAMVTGIVVSNVRKNLINNVGEIIVNKYVSTVDGDLVDQDGWACSLSIPIRAGLKFVIKNITDNYKLWSVAVRNRNYNLIGNIRYEETEISVNDILATYPTALFVDINYYTGSTHAALTPTSVAGWVIDIVDTYAVDNADYVIKTLRKNIIGYVGEIYLNAYVSTVDDTLVDQNGWGCTTNIPIKEGQKIVFDDATENYKLWSVIVKDSHYEKLGVVNPHSLELDVDSIIDTYPTSMFLDINYYTGEPHAAITDTTVEGWKIKIIDKFSLSDAEDQINELNNITIDGYTRDGIELQGTVKDGYAIARDEGEELALANWQYKKANVTPGTSYLVSGSSGTSVALYYYFDSSNHFISHGEFTDYNTDVNNVRTRAPENASYICVNSVSDSASVKLPTQHFVRSGGNVGVEVAPNRYELGTGKMKSYLSLFGTDNGTLELEDIYYDGVVFKQSGDDVCPVNFDTVRYVGANHGYYYGYEVTAANHGMGYADIGNGYTYAGITYILLQINSRDTFTVVALDPTSWAYVKTVNNFAPMFEFVDGNKVTVGSYRQKQLYPSAKNIDVHVAYNGETFIISESYDIIDLKSGITYIRGHIGTNQNISFATRANAAVTIRNLYEFSENGACSITQNIKQVNPNAIINFYGGVQSGQFGSSDYFAVPMTSYSDLQSNNGDVYFDRNSWTDQTKPPIIYCQTENDKNSANKMMLTGVIMEDRNNYLDDNAGFIYRTKKMYPYAIEPATALLAKETLGFVSLRIPMYKNEYSADIKFVGWCKCANKYYLYCYNPSATIGTIKVPSGMLGKRVNTLIAENATCLNELISTCIDVEFTNEGHLFVEITD